MTRSNLACLLVVLLTCSLSCAQNRPAPAVNSVAERLGYPANSRLLILHADDLGMSHSENRATIEAMEKHWVTSASILVPCPWFSEVAHWAKAHPDADLGVHLALNSDWTTLRWGPVSPQPRDSSLLDQDGYLPLTTAYVAAHANMSDVEAETHAQIDKAKSAGIHLSHLDTHMGTIVSTPEMFKVYFGLGQVYKLPVLLDDRAAAFGVPSDAILLNKVLAIVPGVPKSQWLEAYEKLLAPLPPGSYQLIVHLAYDDEEMRGATFDHPDWGAEWRQNDFDMVRSSEFRKFLKDQGFILVSWRDLAKAGPKS